MPFDDTQGKPEDKRSTRSQREEKILAFWKDNSIFEKTLEKDSPEGDFVFYEGPPTANAKPAFHHLEARAFKDAIPRYKTMRGFRVPRKAGWDTHGLPVELQIEKKLGLTSKKDIESFGVEKFNKECKDSVFEYIGDWEKFTDRIGYWVNKDDAYYTFENSYIESVWSVVKEVEKRDLLYKDFKVVPWCPRCGTALSSHELAQGYQDVKDLSLFVKFKMAGEPNTFFLAWTTTPWTLPGNVALAVGKDIQYVKVKAGEEFYILAESRLSIIPTEYDVVEKIMGSELVGRAYEPHYPYVRDIATESEQKKFVNAFQVYAADFVTTVDGTGIVHTAVMYGQEDFDLGTKVGLPKVHLVRPDGTFMQGTGWLEGRSVVESELAVDILKDLQARGLYFNKENHLHSYPFCWRCKTRLIYYARDSWYIRMSEIRDELVEENKKINWEPNYIKEGRFGEWLREVKDWALSRERYWGTPLPVWLTAGGDRLVIDSVESLRKYTKKSGNTYLAIRHGQAGNNVNALWDFENDQTNHLTEVGVKQIEASAELLKKMIKNTKIDIIVRSPILRAEETSEIVQKAIGFTGEVVVDKRLTEFNPGHKYQNEPLAGFLSQYKHYPERYTIPNPDGENYGDLKRRAMQVVEEYELTYKNKTILFVSHGAPILNMILGSKGLSAKQIEDDVEMLHYPKNGEIKEINFVPFPHNESFELDLHRPFIDSIVLEKGGEDYYRTKEVMDVWLDSGSMPFASNQAGYPADFISEAIDQTRGWFYTLHAVGVLMGKGRAFKNVICLGHILDKEGKKMSKSVGNILDPWMLMDKYGVDVLRLWMYSVNQPGESKNFDEQTVQEVERKVFNLIDNVCAFYELYRDKSLETKEITLGMTHLLDEWIIAKLGALIANMTTSLDSYKLLEPTRALREFADDLSTWYVRRSRERLKSGDVAAKETLYVVLKTYAILLAPFAPFTAEELYQKLRTKDDVLSVHLETWPEAVVPHKEEVFANMEKVRHIVSLGLEARNKINMKIRQPLARIEVKNWDLTPDYAQIIMEEVNVKLLHPNLELDTEVRLDAELTPELIEEGKVREIIRSIQDMRKEKDLKPSDEMEVLVSEADREIFLKYKAEIQKATNTTFA